MKLILLCALCLLLCYMHEVSSTASKSSTAKKPVDKSKKDNSKTAGKSTGGINKGKSKDKETKRNAPDSKTNKDKVKLHKRDVDNREKPSKPRKTPILRTPFDKTLEKLSQCAESSPSLVDVMQENLLQLQTDDKYQPLFNSAPHVANFILKETHDPTKFISELRQALYADWSNPTWKSSNEIETIFRPLKQQFVYAMMRFNCT